MIFGSLAVLSSCGKKECEHPNMTYTEVDAKNHQGTCPDCGYTTKAAHKWKKDEVQPEEGKTAQTCDLCGAKRVVNGDAYDPWQEEFDGKEYPWSKTELVMSVNDNSNQGELEAGGKAFVSGEWTQENINPGNTISAVDDGILRQIITRNTTASSVTGVTMRYVYMSDVGWGSVLDRIATESAADSTPDIYYNLLYDMIGASVKGYFKNIYNNEYLGCFYDNYNPDKDTHGYYWEYMKDLTFSTKVMYLIASDYSFDLARSYLVMPISLKLLSTVTEVTGDYDENGLVDIDDFYAMINAGDWTWTKIMAYTEAVKKPDKRGGYSLQGDSVAGLAMSYQSGLTTSAIVYAAGAKIVDRTVGADGEYVYTYPDTCPDSLIKVCDMLFNNIAGTEGQRDQTYTPKGTSGIILYKGHTSLVEEMFAQNRVLINPSAVLGAIEKSSYRSMWDTDTGSEGFAVAPMAKLESEDPYRTVIHNCCKVFAVSSKCNSVDAACAFINHNSVNSTDILKEYYEWALGYGRAVTTENTKILLAMKDAVVYSHDKTVEDAINLLHGSEIIQDPLGESEMELHNICWHTFSLQYWRCNQISQLYAAVKDYKQKTVNEIQAEFLQGANR